jgi:hypothetical protein
MGHPSTAAGQAVAADNMAGQQQLPQNNPWLGRLAVGWIMAVQFAARGIHRWVSQPRALMLIRSEGAKWT